MDKNRIYASMLAQYSQADIRKKIKKANSIIESTDDIDLIHKEIDNVILFGFENQWRSGLLPLDRGTLREGAIVYRVRPVSHFDRDFHESDFWRAPKEYVKSKGRLNEVGESFLYCANNPEVAMKEALVHQGGRFILMAYRVVENLTLNGIGDYSGVSTELRKKLRHILKFLEKNFYGVDKKYYIFSNYFAKKYLDFNDSGYSYDSVKMPGDRNYCFNDAGVNRLELLRVFCANNYFGLKILGCLELNNSYSYKNYDTEEMFLKDFNDHASDVKNLAPLSNVPTNGCSQDEFLFKLLRK